MNISFLKQALLIDTTAVVCKLSTIEQVKPRTGFVWVLCGVHNIIIYIIIKQHNSITEIQEEAT